MEKANSQQELYKDRVAIKHEFGYLVIDKKQYKFLYTYFKKNQKTFVLACAFLALQAFLEIVFISLGHDIAALVGKPFYQRFSTIFLIGTIGTILMYVGSVYWSLYFERKFVLGVTNQVRKKMFLNVFNKEASKVTLIDRMGLVSKVSYHLSLFTLGLDNAGVSILRWFFYFTAMIVYVVVFQPSYVYYLLLIFALSVICYVGSYIVSNRYVSKEAASYSRIIEQVVHAVFNFHLIKKFNLERSVTNNLDKVVDVDTYFRIRRDIWIRYSNRIIIILVVIGAVIFSAFNNYYGLKINLTTNLLLQGIIYIFIIRLLYLMVRAGIYTPPLRIGVFLCIPLSNYILLSGKKNWPWERITFFSNKVKPFPEANYYKDFSIAFEKGKRYLFTAEKFYSGKSSFAAIFAGLADYSRHSFMVKLDNRRLTYNEWAEQFYSKYLFSTYMAAYSTVGEFLFKKSRKDINSADIESLSTLLKSDSIFDNFTLGHNFLTNSVEEYANNFTILFYLHAIHAIINKPDLVIIDNLWIDLNYPEINRMMKFLEIQLPNSTIIVFSRQPNHLINYQEEYEINPDSIQKISN